MRSQQLNKPSRFSAAIICSNIFIKQRNPFDVIKIHLLRTKNITSVVRNPCDQF